MPPATPASPIDGVRIDDDRRPPVIAQRTQITAEGRVAATLLMVLGIGLFSVITATMTSALLAGAADAPAGSRTAANRLRNAKELHQAGILTTAEYEAKRGEIIRAV